MKQISFWRSPALEYGGTIPRRRKVRRPLASKRPLHLVLKARRPVLHARRAFLESEIRRLASRFRLRVYEVAVSFDHIHFALKIPSRREYRAFIRSLTGLVARKMGKGLWKLLPYTRVLTWGRAYRHLVRYIDKNRREANGEIPYEPRKRRPDK